MSENISIQKQTEIMKTWLLYHAGYDFERDKEKKLEKKERPEMNPLSCLHMVNDKVNQEATV